MAKFFVIRYKEDWTTHDDGGAWSAARPNRTILHKGLYQGCSRANVPFKEAEIFYEKRLTNWMNRLRGGCPAYRSQDRHDRYIANMELVELDVPEPV